MMLSWVLISGCRATSAPAPSDSGASDSATPPVDPACLEAPPPGPRPVEVLPLLTEEDFDFDATGLLVAQDVDTLVGYDRAGAVTIVSPAVDGDPAGIRVLPWGDIVVVHPALGTLSVVDGDTGGVTVLLGGLQSPNGLDVGRDGTIYVTEFVRGGGVRQVDPETGAFTVLTQEGSLNAVALSPDERTLYLSDWSYPTFGVVALDRQPDGTWTSAPRLVATGLPDVQGLSLDQCGRLYAVDFSSGGVYRIDVEAGTVDALVDGGVVSSVFSSARFAPGFGGFSRTALYVTDRTAIYEVDVGVIGHHPLAP